MQQKRDILDHQRKRCLKVLSQIHNTDYGIFGCILSETLQFVSSEDYKKIDEDVRLIHHVFYRNDERKIVVITLMLNQQDHHNQVINCEVDFAEFKTVRRFARRYKILAEEKVIKKVKL